MMNVHKLIRLHQEKNPNSHFFDKGTLKFFGERLSEMRILSRRVTVIDCGNDIHRDCYILSTYQHNSPCTNKRTHKYFDAETFDVIIMP